MTSRPILIGVLFCCVLAATTVADAQDVGVKAVSPLRSSPTPARRPNILFLMADDWSSPYAGVLGDPVVRTPTFDRVAQ